jgi:hypothetical protein
MSVSTLEHVRFDFLGPEPEKASNNPPEQAVAQALAQRCQAGGCRKKLGLVPIQCKCKGYYCAGHRADAEHQCSYDYRAEHRAQLNTSMVKVAGKKLDTL